MAVDVQSTNEIKKITMKAYKYVVVRIIPVIAALTFCGMSQAQSVDGMDREYLTGDWGGARKSLKESGINFLPRATFFYQGTNKDDHTIGGKADLKVSFNGARIGLSKWTLNTQIEYNFGKSIDSKAITLYPLNMTMYQPGDTGADRFDASNYSLAYTPSKSLTLRFGKFNMVEMAAGNRFQGGAGIDGPMHSATVATPTGVIPPYLVGGIVGWNTKLFNYTLMVYDPQSYVNKNSFNDLFKEVTFSLNIELPVKIGDLPGSQNIKGIFSTQGGTDLSNINLPEENIEPSQKSSKFFLSYNFNQYLVKFNESGAGFGVYGTFNLSDGNPNIVRSAVVLGIGGNSFLPKRSTDRWGFGFFHINVSKGLKEFAATRVPLGNEWGFESYYNYNLNSWWHIGANLQWIQSSLKDYGNVFCVGLRTRILL